MENDKLFNDIKKAAESPDVPRFDALDKVWGKVESKLDNKLLKKQNNKWKQLAIAASMLLVLTLGYLMRDSQDEVNIKEAIVTTESATPVTQPAEEQTIPEQTLNENIKPDAPAILQERLVEDHVAVSATSAKETQTPLPIISDPSAQDSKMELPKFESRGVVREQSVEVAHDQRTGKIAVKKPDPLVVVDGKAVSKKEFDKNIKKDLSGLSAEEMEEIVVLPNPLYIINGVRYSEEELFGVVPTSPYAPLNEQEIESISILQGKQATDVYGEKGKLGVVIITTKYGRPKPKK